MVHDMSRFEIGSMVRVSDDYHKTCLVGKIGKVVAYSVFIDDDDYLVQFEGMDGNRNLESGKPFNDRDVDGKFDKKWFIQEELELVEKEKKK